MPSRTASGKWPVYAVFIGFGCYVVGIFLYTVVVGGSRTARINHDEQVLYEQCLARNQQVAVLNASMETLRNSDFAITVTAAQDLVHADSRDPAVQFARDDIAGIRKRIDAYDRVLHAYQPVNCQQSVYGGQ